MITKNTNPWIYLIGSRKILSDIVSFVTSYSHMVCMMLCLKLEHSSATTSLSGIIPWVNHWYNFGTDSWKRSTVGKDVNKQNNLKCWASDISRIRIWIPQIVLKVDSHLEYLDLLLFLFPVWTWAKHSRTLLCKLFNVVQIWLSVTLTFEKEGITRSGWD